MNVLLAIDLEALNQRSKMNTEQNITLPLFMEKYFGEMQTTSEFHDVGPYNDHLYVVGFDLFEGIRTYATLGLSEKNLYYIRNDKKEYIKEEILFSVNYKEESRKEDFKYMRMLAGVVEIIFENNNYALLRGSIFDVEEPLVEGTKMSAFYVSYPSVYFDGKDNNDVSIIYERTDPVTLIMWLIPIYDSEVKYIREHGWSLFEDILVEKNPDYFDLQREPVI
ncbi:suppressor of fused domain protein [Aristophania vespae]|uniref:suppressor of fused domain protein n=1 Tax=Aristophania vespae TaxID=2697033 RepID=UPI0023515BDF|nr:suppressor of fused domain protein [Aristophania vespae]UMM64036.1 hypothetical protein DM15PD_10170 [Aristophania vespae]